MAEAAEGSEEHSRADEEEAAERPSPLKRPAVRRGLVIAAIVVAAVLILLFVRYETHGKYIQSTDDAYVRANTVTVSPKVSGYVDQLFVTDNQDVKAGQPLVHVDPRDYRAQVAQYRAQVDVANADIANGRAMVREQQAAVAQAEAELASAESSARFAAHEEARYRPLAASGAETREKLSSLHNQAVQTANDVAGRRAALASARQRIGALAAQVRQSEAQRESAQAQLSAADVNLGSTVVRASVDGRVGDKTVRVGQFVQTGTPMMSIVPLQAIYVTANFKETQIGRMRPGQPARIEVDALGGAELAGHVDSISPGTGAEFSLLPPQNATGNFTKIVQRVPVRIAIDAGPLARAVLVPGLSVKVKVDTISARDAEEAIQQQEKARREAGR